LSQYFFNQLIITVFDDDMESSKLVISMDNMLNHGNYEILDEFPADGPINKLYYAHPDASPLNSTVYYLKVSTELWAEPGSAHVEYGLRVDVFDNLPIPLAYGVLESTAENDYEAAHESNETDADRVANVTVSFYGAIDSLDDPNDLFYSVFYTHHLSLSLLSAYDSWASAVETKNFTLLVDKQLGKDFEHGTWLVKEGNWHLQVTIPTIKGSYTLINVAVHGSEGTNTYRPLIVYTEDDDWSGAGFVALLICCCCCLCVIVSLLILGAAVICMGMWLAAAGMLTRLFAVASGMGRDVKARVLHQNGYSTVVEDDGGYASNDTPFPPDLLPAAANSANNQDSITYGEAEYVV
jgi:hypothetical protein